MELQIKKWGVLRDSTIPLPGLTVIGGYNATGKSTVGKLLLAMVKHAQASVLANGTEGLGDALEVFIRMFGHEADEAGEVSLLDGDRSCRVRKNNTFYSGDLVTDCRFVDASVLETPFVAAFSKMFQQVHSYVSRDIASIKIDYPYAMNDVYGKMITERNHISREQKGIAEEIYNNIKGRISIGAMEAVFIEETTSGKRKIDVRSTASGQLGLSIFAKLLENGWIAKDTITIFDEPESHLHPHWQLIYAKMLVRCVEELGATIVVTTHTPYMLQALKVFSDQSLKGKAAFCIAERKGDYAQISVDESPDLAKIAPLMTEPMRRIQLLRDWDYES